MESLDQEPQALKDRPEVDDHLVVFWEAFWFLCPGRPVGMSVGAIPLTEVICYLKDIAEITDIQKGVYLIRLLDIEYLKHANKAE